MQPPAAIQALWAVKWLQLVRLPEQEPVCQVQPSRQVASSRPEQGGGLPEQPDACQVQPAWSVQACPDAMVLQALQVPSHDWEPQVQPGSASQADSSVRFVQGTQLPLQPLSSQEQPDVASQIAGSPSPSHPVQSPSQ